MSYGVTPIGFVRKPLSVILSEIEESAKVVFGPGIIQSPQSPLGQLNYQCASIVTTAWEIAESTYQSYDPDQAEGVRLEQLARIRLLERIAGEGDPEFRAAITNSGRARIDIADIKRGLFGVDGVTYAEVFVNGTSDIDADGLPPHSVCVAVLGGDDEAVARALRPFIAPGVDSAGNTRLDVAIDGYCRTVRFTRPKLVPLGLQLVARTTADRLGCPPPAAAAIGLAASNGLTGANRPVNGQDVTLHMVRNAVSCVYPNVEIVSARANLFPDYGPQDLPYPIAFDEIASIVPAAVTVEFL